jgi:outer membrane protein insertion porin family
MNQPPLRRLPLKSGISVFFRREAETNFLTSRKGVSANGEYRLGEYNLVGAGFRFEWVHTYEKVPDPLFPFDVRLRLAPVTGSFARDTRDDTVDAASGRFSSHTLEWSPAALGADLSYIKYFGQYFQYFPIGEPSRVPWTGETRNRTVYAFGGRVGLAQGFAGQTVAPSERFFAGGGTTIRGFGKDSLGPLDFRSQPAGGNAVLILNSELRFPVYGFLDGVGFVDAGNVYRHVEDFTLRELRTSAGTGLRIRTPYALLRFDYGVNLRPRPGEARGNFFFSIGQAF